MALSKEADRKVEFRRGPHGETLFRTKEHAVLRSALGGGWDLAVQVEHFGKVVAVLVPPVWNRPPHAGPLVRWVRRLPRESPRDDSARKRAARQGLPSAAGWWQAEDAREESGRAGNPLRESPPGLVLADARRDGGTAASGCANSAGSGGPVHPSRRLWRAATLRAEGTPSHNLDIMRQSTISSPALDLMR